MTLTQLRQLVAIVDAGLNITVAAGRVHATQSGLSKQLKQLEAELGTPLFSRRGRSLEALTPDGVEIVERSRRLLAEAENIRAHAANQRGDASGTLSIVSTHTQARFILPPAVAELRRNFPGVQLRLEPAGDVEVMQRLRDCTTDLGLLSSVGAAPDVGLAIPLFRWSRKVLVPLDHPLAASLGAPSLAELARYPLVSYESSRHAQSSLCQAFAAEALRPEIAVTARDADLIKTYVRAGLGIGILAEMGLLPEDHHAFRVLPAPAALPDCTAWAMLPAGRVVRQYTIDLIQMLAPWLDRHDLRRTIDGVATPLWGSPPHWPMSTLR
ncbi:MAG: LysR substrate-binding domain-containing protein [Xanthomonadaceae bacterium]|nr:LysR substrate-binding domain-containing protein [Xanthomonadaceae bacterium]MDP2186368.1 LysR substrate-binding domain-containing protein [Xanthomonadales bacterium]MDZ4114698.1 LysR substrate-binding domain-containing protein [Xanthomonadaceae bacterium]MDZ4377248.1 LysR substrate-binding domain-containing protein [Xanthomonadaceae bacterium]